MNLNYKNIKSTTYLTKYLYNVKYNKIENKINNISFTDIK
jgi:hypothetical protein